MLQQVLIVITEMFILDSDEPKKSTELKPMKNISIGSMPLNLKSTH